MSRVLDLLNASPFGDVKETGTPPTTPPTTTPSPQVPQASPQKKEPANVVAGREARMTQPTEEAEPEPIDLDTQTNVVAGREARNVQPVATVTKKEDNATDTKKVEAPKPTNLTELYLQLNPYRPQTEEQIAQREKKEKRDRMIAALGDGIAALSNLFAVHQGAANAYNPETSLSASVRKQQERLKAEREVKDADWRSAMMKYRASDIANEKEERSWRRILGLDERDEKRYNEELEMKREAVERNEKRYADEMAIKRAAIERDEKRYGDKMAMEKRKMDQAQSNFEKTHDLQVKTQQDAKELKQAAIDATKAKILRGKEVLLANNTGAGGNLKIYESIWRGAVPQAYNILSEANKTAKAEGKRTGVILKPNASYNEMENAVKQYWLKFPEVKEYLEHLATLDPATFTTEDEGEEDNEEEVKLPSPNLGKKSQQNNTKTPDY